MTLLISQSACPEAAKAADWPPCESGLKYPKFLSGKLWPPEEPLKGDTAAGIKAYPLVFETQPLFPIPVAAAGAGTDVPPGIDDAVPGEG